MVERHIIAMGGGGFSMEPENPLLDRYVLQVAGKKNAKVCFVPTASGDSVDYIERFLRAFKKHECETSYLSLFKPPSPDLEDYVMDKDIIYVGGGSTRNLIVLWREWGLDRIFNKAWENGKVLCGVSAGANCWFEQNVTDSNFGELTAIEGLGYLPGSFCPHYDGEEKRRPSYHRLVTEGHIQDGHAADDGAAFHYVGTKLHTVVSSRPNAKGYRLQRVEGVASEQALDTFYLGD